MEQKQNGLRATINYLIVALENGASAYGTPLDGATVKVVITTVNKT